MQHEFGASLERIRKERGLSYRALSESLEAETGVVIDPSGLQRIETGAREPRLFEAIAISKHLGRPLLHMTAPPGVEQATARLKETMRRFEATYGAAMTALVEHGLCRQELLHAVLEAEHLVRGKKKSEIDKDVALAELSRLREQSKDLVRMDWPSIDPAS